MNYTGCLIWKYNSHLTIKGGRIERVFSIYNFEISYFSTFQDIEMQILTVINLLEKSMNYIIIITHKNTETCGMIEFLFEISTQKCNIISIVPFENIMLKSPKQNWDDKWKFFCSIKQLCNKKALNQMACNFRES